MPRQTRGFLVVAGLALSPVVVHGQVPPPKVITVVKALYTREARAARIEGTVLVEVTVLPDGTVSGEDVKVIRLLDTKFGLDDQAVKASKQWTFSPGIRDGKPVAVRVSIEQSSYLNSTK